MVRIKVVFKDLSETIFDSEEIEKVDELDVEGLKTTFITLKDGKQIAIPLSKNEFESEIQKGSEVTLEFDL